MSVVKMKKCFKRTLAVAASVIFAVTLVGQNVHMAADSNQKYTIDLSKNTSNTTSNSLSIKPAARIGDGAILQCFCWDLKTIKANMKDIAEAGYTSVQTSPINACNDRHPTRKLMGNDSNGGTDGAWWWHYQPTDWTIGNYQVGTRDDFKAMCAEADKYGIKVIVDVVPNHTTSDLSAVSQNLINAVGGKQRDLYHDTGLTDCPNIANRYDSTRYKVGHLPDVDTERKDFQDYFIKYLNDCIACGADGFRYDTAKHIGLPDDDRPSWVTNNFWPRVTTEITNAKNIFNYAEDLQGDNERLDSYINLIGSATTSYYGGDIRTAVQNCNLTVNNILNYKVGNASSKDVVTWVESHDNYINDGTWSWLTDEQIKLGWAIISAREDGAPLFFDRPMNGGPGNKWGNNVLGVAGSNLYKDDEVAAVNKFRNAMVGQKENLSNLNGNNQVLMIERGNRGVVFVNAGYNSVRTNYVSTKLADKDYYNLTDQKGKFTVSGGKMDGTIPARSVVVLMDYEDTKPEVSISNYKASFKSDTFTLQLAAKNTEKATIQVNNEESYLYNNGDTRVIGKGDPDGTVYNIELRGANNKGETTYANYKITKNPVVMDTTVYFEKPDNWNDSVYAYVYQKVGTKVEEVNKWPGTLMTKESDGKYSFTFDEEYSNPLIIFNDTKTQSPGHDKDGFPVEDKATYDINGKKPVGENQIVVYYATDWSNANIHYQIGNGIWTSAPGISMTNSDVSGYKMATINLGSNKTMNACFNNGSNTWDNNGTKNYSFNNPGTYTVKDGTVTMGKPTTVSENTTTIYYSTGWNNANMHYQIGNGNWTSAPGVTMSSASGGYKKITVSMGNASSLRFCFNNGRNNWDNHNGHDYSVGSRGIYTVKNGNISSGAPN